MLYKRQGEPQPKNCDNLDDEDFALVLQTPTQAEILKELGKIICIDSTHGTNGYDCNLITILVIFVKFGEGFPVGWCISNREDLLLMINFYAAIKSTVGTISPEWIMSDDAEQFYTTWVCVFANRPHKRLCIWHVDRAWRENLCKIHEKESQASVYKNLRVLLEETNTNKFEKILQRTIYQ